MIILTVDEIIEIQKLLTDKSGGSHGLRDKNLLESAVYSAVSSFGDEQAIPQLKKSQPD